MNKHVIVLGAGNAAFAAAVSARQNGAKVTMIERAPEDEAGGNTRFTAGAIRCVYDGVDDLRAMQRRLRDFVRVEKMRKDGVRDMDDVHRPIDPKEADAIQVFRRAMRATGIELAGECRIPQAFDL